MSQEVKSIYECIFINRDKWNHKNILIPFLILKLRQNLLFRF